MRFMILLKADPNTEAGVMPSEQLLAEMGKYNEELVKAGVMLAGEGLHPSSRGEEDPFGHSWMLAEHVKDLTPEEIDKGQEAFFAQMQQSS